MTLLLLFGGSSASAATAADFALAVRAAATDMLLHAEATAGERNTIYLLAELTDESGELLVDETGTILAAFGETGAIVLHAEATGGLLHAEDVP